MGKKKGMFAAIACGLAWAIYFVSALCRSDDWSNFTAPVSTLLAGGILLIAYFRSHGYKIHLLLAGLASISFMAADIGWAITAVFRHQDPEQSLGLMILYAFPNFFLAVAAAALVGSSRRIWYRIQLIVDVLASSCIGLSAFWIIFLHNEFSSLLGMNVENMIMFFYAFADIFIFCCLAVWISSLDGSKIASSQKIFVTGIFAYAAVDLTYSYQFFNDTYVPNSILDILYLLAMIMMALGGLLRLMRPDSLPTDEIKPDLSKRRQSRKFILLMLAPVFLVIVKGINWKEILFLAAIIAIHQIISSYITTARISEKLLMHEKQMNFILEEQIAKRTKELVAINKELEIVSNHDSITNFYNRRFFILAFDRMLQEIQPADSIVLFFADLDRFKAINDTFGHDIGDQVLVEIAKRMKRWNQYRATIARLGGDEFVVAVQGCFHFAEAAEMANALIRHCSEPIVIPPHQFQITLSLGITFYPFDARERGTLMKNADIAMYQAKAQGCNRFVFFSSLIKESAVEV